MKTNKCNFITEAELAQMLGCSRSVIRKGRMSKKAKSPKGLFKIPYFRMGKLIKYLKEDVDKWLIENRVELD